MTKRTGQAAARACVLLCGLWLAGCSARDGAGQQIGAQASPQQGQSARPAQTPATTPAAVKIYRGTLSDRGIELRLAREGERLSGAYSYDGIGQELRLEGRGGDGGKFTLAEFDAGGKQTGQFVCDGERPGEWDHDLSCNWSKPGGGDERFVALYEQHADFKSSGLRVAPKVSENRKFGVRVSYPQLAPRAGAQLPPTAAAFNKLIENRINTAVGGFVKDLEKGEKNLYFHTNYNALLATDDLVSVEWAEDSYTGGAHPSFYYKALTYDLRAGRELKLGELFKPGSDYAKAIRAHAFKQINERAGEGDAAAQGGKPVVAEEMLGDISAWGLTPRGLMIYYDLPHVIAVFQRSFVPYGALKEHLRPDGPASRYARP